MSCPGNLVWDVNKRLIGYNEPNTIRTNYLGKNKTSLRGANVSVGEISRKHAAMLTLDVAAGADGLAPRLPEPRGVPPKKPRARRPARCVGSFM